MDEISWFCNILRIPSEPFMETSDARAVRPYILMFTPMFLIT